MPHEVPHLGGRIVAASGDEDLRLFRINQNFIQIAQFIQDVERMWEVSESTPLGFGLPALFGDGSDGDVIISSGTNLASCDIKQYRNLTVAASQTLGTSASSVATMILCVSEVLSVQGTISMDGKGGAPATDYSSSYGASGGGGGGGSSGAGTQGGDSVVSGGAGGNSGGSHTAGTAGSAIGACDKAKLRMSTTDRNNVLVSWGSGGGAGGAGSGSAGAGGNGGGAIIILAHRIIIGSSGAITADGAAGSSVSTGGGGGGGGGGCIYIVSKDITNAGSIAAAAGAAGSGTGSTGSNGAAGGAGTVVQEII